MTGEKQKFSAPPPVADINVTPMVDVMLVMLIIFMVITPMLSKGVTVELVKTNHPIAMQAADKSDAIVCAVTREGKTFLGTTATPPEDLPGKVKDLLSGRLDKTVFVKAGGGGGPGRVVEVAGSLRAAGVDRLGRLTDSKEKGKMDVPPAAPSGK